MDYSLERTKTSVMNINRQLCNLVVGRIVMKGINTSSITNGC